VLEALNTLDTRLFLAINGTHCDIMDFVMYWASNKVIWAPFYAFLVYLLVMHYRRQSWILVLMAIVLIVICDQTSVHFFKEVVHRLRPCHEPALQGLVRLPDDKCGGQYGFVSSHAVNSFALAVFIGYFLGKKIRHFLAVMLVWAAIIGYSRIYNGVHYPIDVIAGAAWGSLLAAGMVAWGRNLIKSGFKV
jgi:undecaprenyl-diphosphatase